MSKTDDIFVCLRNRDFDGLGEWLETLLELAKDDAMRSKTGMNRFDGHVLVPLIQSADKEASSALLANSKVRRAMQRKDIEHDAWVLDLSERDTFAWLWALEQGWGTLVEPRPSVLKNLTIMRAHGFVEEYFADTKRMQADKVDMQSGKNAWDGWLRRASARSPWLVTYLYTPSQVDLQQAIQCSQNMSFPSHFWQRLEVFYPGAGQIREDAKSTYSGLGLPYGSAQDKVVLGKAMGLIPIADESISMEFEPGQ